MLFILAVLALIFVSGYFFGEQKTNEIMNNYIVIWLLAAFYIGQYSMKFPKSR